jgi:hypothetical protein
MFKAKIEDLSPTKQEAPTQIDPVVAKSIDDFVNIVVTEARCTQGLQEVCNGDSDIKGIGGFLRWINQDIQKENQDELEASKLVWKQVAKQVNYRAKQWFLKEKENG